MRPYFIHVYGLSRVEAPAIVKFVHNDTARFTLHYVNLCELSDAQ